MRRRPTASNCSRPWPCSQIGEPLSDDPELLSLRTMLAAESYMYRSATQRDILEVLSSCPHPRAADLAAAWSPSTPHRPTTDLQCSGVSEGQDIDTQRSYAMKLANDSYEWYRSHAARSRRNYKGSETALVIIAAAVPTSAVVAPTMSLCRRSWGPWSWSSRAFAPSFTGRIIT